MVGTSKILTVSYGTFSCTLEGFDDPFSTMRSIAEYFRDLAADDRYFGAEPPTPDAEMLHRIAEREVKRRVIASVEGNGVTLRQTDDDQEAAAEEPGQPQTDAPAVDDRARRKKKNKKDRAKAKALALAGAQRPAAGEAAPAKPQIAHMPPPPAEDFASRMLRIRAAAARSAATDALVEDQDAGAPWGFQPISSAFADVAPARDAGHPDEDLPESADSARPDVMEPMPLDDAADMDAAGTWEPETWEEVVIDSAAAGTGQAARDTEAADEAGAPPEAAPALDDAEGATAGAGASDDASPAAAEAALEETGPADAAPAASAPADAETAESEPADAASAETASADAEAEDIGSAPDQPSPAAEPDATDAEEADTGYDVEDPGMMALLRSIRAGVTEEEEDDAGLVARVSSTEVDIVETEIWNARDNATPTQPQGPRLVRARVVKMRRVDQEHRQDEPLPAAADAGQIDGLPPMPALAPEPAVEDAAGDADQDAEGDFSIADAVARAISDDDFDDDLDTAGDADAETAGGRAAFENLFSDEPAEEAEEAADADSAGAAVDDDADEDAETAKGRNAEQNRLASRLARSTLPADEEADLLAELAAVEADAASVAAPERPASEEPGDAGGQARAAREGEDARPAAAEEAPQPAHAARAGKSVLDRTATGDDASISRILAETNNQLDDSESSRRRSTIAHLKAAVAATRADRDDGVPEARGEDLGQYRDDLERVVRPRRPGERSTGTTRRLAPLMLVSEQRIDLPRADLRADAAAIRPRRVTTGNLALMEDDAADDDLAATGGRSLGENSSLADYVRGFGATELPDLLEATAAFTAYVEGRPSFSRQQLVKQAETVAGDAFGREEGLRAFGTLLRNGRIRKLKRGQFAIAPGSRFHPERAQH